MTCRWRFSLTFGPAEAGTTIVSLGHEHGIVPNSFPRYLYICNFRVGLTISLLRRYLFSWAFQDAVSSFFFLPLEAVLCSVLTTGKDSGAKLLEFESSSTTVAVLPWANFSSSCGLDSSCGTWRPIIGLSWELNESVCIARGTDLVIVLHVFVPWTSSTCFTNILSTNPDNCFIRKHYLYPYFTAWENGSLERLASVRSQS